MNSHMVRGFSLDPVYENQAEKKQKESTSTLSLRYDSNLVEVQIAFTFKRTSTNALEFKLHRRLEPNQAVNTHKFDYQGTWQDISMVTFNRKYKEAHVFEYELMLTDTNSKQTTMPDGQDFGNLFSHPRAGGHLGAWLFL